MEAIEIKWDLLGAKLAAGNDDEQTEFFKGFAFELDKFETKYKIQLQMSYVANKLTRKEKDILKNAFDMFSDD